MCCVFCRVGDLLHRLDGHRQRVGLTGEFQRFAKAGIEPRWLAALDRGFESRGSKPGNVVGGGRFGDRQDELAGAVVTEEVGHSVLRCDNVNEHGWRQNSFARCARARFPGALHH